MLGSNTGDDGMHKAASGNMTERNGKTDIGVRFAWCELRMSLPLAISEDFREPLLSEWRTRNETRF